MKYKIKLKRDEKLLTVDIDGAETFYTRTLGLMFKENMEDMNGLLLNPCKSIHTFFMRFPIDAMFLDKNNSIVKLYRELRPWKITPLIWKAQKVIEFPGGKIPQDIAEGDELEVICIS